MPSNTLISLALGCLLGYAKQTDGEVSRLTIGGILDGLNHGPDDARLPSNTVPSMVARTVRTRSSQEKFRRAVFVRDAGVCAVCLRACADAHCEMESIWYAMQKGDLSNVEIYLATLAEYGVERPSLAFPPTLWEADHVIPLAEGGSNDLTNGRTLCLACHRQATISLLRRLYCDHVYGDEGLCVGCGSAA